MCLAALLLAGCSAETGVSKAPQKACHLERVAELPMVARTPFAIIPARLDGHAVSMLLDTGDERLTVTRLAQRSLGLPEDQHHSTRVHGVGGTTTSNDAIIQRFEIGDVELPQSGASVVDMAEMPSVEPPLAGIIGGQILSDYDVEFNFATRKVAFWQRSDCTDIAPAWQGAWSTARLARGTGNLMTLDVMIEGQAVRALLDTGARNTIIDYAAAGRLGITAATLSAARLSVNRGADGNDVFTRRQVLHDVAIGNARADYLVAFVGPVKVPFADMLLGVDFLRNRDVWVAYAAQELFIR